MFLKLLFTSLGLILLNILIWFFGPLFFIGTYQPLGSTFARVLFIVIINVAGFTPLIYRWYQIKKNKAILSRALVENDALAKDQDHQIESTFKQALATLKKTAEKKSFWQRRKTNLYDLPWFAFIGPPGSGKTTALSQSGLEFPIQSQQKGQSIKGVGGTQNCDWWFTNEAVLIDTAGRFTTQDSSKNDERAWRKFLELLQQTRPKQPINGIILTMSATDLMQPPGVIDQMAFEMRNRLQEMCACFSVKPPIYILITKLDLLPGFVETFGALSKEEIKNGWGITLDPNTDDEQPIQQLINGFNSVIQQTRIGVNSKLANERSLDRRKAIFEFPEHLAKLARPFKACLEKVFETESRYTVKNRVRGFYLCSGTQKGSAIGNIAAQFSTDFSNQNGHSRAYFIEKVLKQVIFTEQGLVGLVKKQVFFEKLSKIGIGVTTTVLTAALLMAWFTSRNNNLETIAAIEEKTAELTPALTQINVKQVGINPHTLETLNALRQLGPLNQFKQEPAGWQHGLGLNQYEKLHHIHEKTYTKALENTLLPQIHQRLEQLLAKNIGQDQEITYETLKTYIMFHDSQYRDVESVSQWVHYDWQANLLKNLNSTQREQALTHLKNAVLKTNWQRLPAFNQELVSQARSQLLASPIEARIYSRIQRVFELNQASVKAPPSTIHANITRLFERQSGQSWVNNPNPFFTQTGFYKHFYPELTKQLNNLLNETQWVLGQNQNPNQSIQAIGQEVRRNYVEDYIAHWEAYINDIRLRPIQDLNQAIEITRQLSTPQSPLQQLLTDIAAQTTLNSKLKKASENVQEEALSAIESKTPSKLSGLTDSINLESTQIEQNVDDHFKKLNALFNTATAYDQQVLSILKNLFLQLSALKAAQNDGLPPPSANEFRAISTQADALPEPLRSSIQRLASTAYSENLEIRKGQLNSKLRPLLNSCSRSLAGRYPFNKQASLEVLKGDFERHFNPSGLIQSFFNANLAQRVDQGQTLWRFRDEPENSGTNQTLLQFQRANLIKEAFFQEKAQASFNFQMELVQSSHPNDTFYLQYDDRLTMFSLEFDPSHQLSWPPKTSSTQSELSYRSSDDTSAIKIPGYWALFRFFDRSELRNGNGPEQFISKITLGDKWFEFRVTAQSALNPLRLNALKRFSCPRGL